MSSYYNKKLGASGKGLKAIFSVIRETKDGNNFVNKGGKYHG